MGFGPWQHALCLVIAIAPLILYKFGIMEILDYEVYTNKNGYLAANPGFAPKMSIVVAFYNSVRFFDIQMASLECQTFKNFEVVICDDGSRPEVVAHVRSYMKKHRLLMHHFWHKDDGWRKVEMLNKAIANCTTDYLLMVDQDCVLHPEFVGEHFAAKAPNTALAGRRVELTPWLSNFITPERVRSGYLKWNYGWMIFFLFFQKNSQWRRAIYIKNKFLRRKLNQKSRSILGCNVSYNKADLEKINGVDMSFSESCGAEDSDIDIRLRNAGVEIRSLCYVAVQYHLYHTIRKVDGDLPEVFARHKRDRIVKTTKGLNLIQPVSWKNL